MFLSWGSSGINTNTGCSEKEQSSRRWDLCLLSQTKLCSDTHQCKTFFNCTFWWKWLFSALFYKHVWVKYPVLYQPQAAGSRSWAVLHPSHASRVTFASVVTKDVKHQLPVLFHFILSGFYWMPNSYHFHQRNHWGKQTFLLEKKIKSNILLFESKINFHDPLLLWLVTVVGHLLALVFLCTEEKATLRC